MSENFRNHHLYEISQKISGKLRNEKIKKTKNKQTFFIIFVN